jgi:DNA-binding response OmpR family regulator
MIKILAHFFLLDFFYLFSLRTATLNGEEIALTVREFDILFKLLSYPKKTLNEKGV